MGNSIIVSSGKGGVGKTNIVVNLGIALAKLGKKVIVIDGSLTTPDISLHLGIPFNVGNLAHIFRGESDVKGATFVHESGLKIIPGNVHADALEEFEDEKISKLLNEMKEEHDFVLIDSAAGLGRETVSAIKNSDEMLVVVNPELASIVNSSKIIKLAKEHNVKPIGIVLNRMGRYENELKEENIKTLLHNIPIIGRIPEDEKIPHSMRESKSIVHHYPHSGASKALMNIAASICGEKQEPNSLFYIKAKHSFILSNGKELNSLKELMASLVNMGDETFYQHVNENKSDFAAWIYDVFGDQKVAEQVGKIKTRMELFDFLNKGI